MSVPGILFAPGRVNSILKVCQGQVLSKAVFTEQQVSVHPVRWTPWTCWREPSVYTQTSRLSGPMQHNRASCFPTHLFFIDLPVLVGGTWVVTQSSFQCHGGSANLSILSVFVGILWPIQKRLVHLAFFIWCCCLLAVDVCAPMGLCSSWNSKPSSVVMWCERWGFGRQCAIGWCVWR